MFNAEKDYGILGDFQKRTSLRFDNFWKVVKSFR